jgi:hypothetical protein
MIKLGILVVAKRLVIAASLAKGVDPHKGMMSVLDPSGSSAKPMGGSTCPEQ